MLEPALVSHLVLGQDTGDPSIANELLPGSAQLVLFALIGAILYDVCKHVRSLVIHGYAWPSNFEVGHVVAGVSIRSLCGLSAAILLKSLDIITLPVGVFLVGFTAPPMLDVLGKTWPSRKSNPDVKDRSTLDLNKRDRREDQAAVSESDVAGGDGEWQQR